MVFWNRNRPEGFHEVTTKDALHRLIEELPDDALPGVERYLAAMRDDPMLRVLIAAPLDEPTSAEEDASAREGIERYRSGEYVTAEEARAGLFG